MAKNKSPLRYPGGKTRAINILEKYITEHYPKRSVLLSPFFGGGSFELHMKSQGYKVYANDLFVPLYTFWHTLKDNHDELIAAIRGLLGLTKEGFTDLRKRICNMNDPLEQAAAYFAINRSSFSGATLCGGFSKEAAEKRFTESSIVTAEKCDLADIEFTNMDCCEFLKLHEETAETVIYADPPYYIEKYIYGKDGDMHSAFDHAGFAECIMKRRDWIVSYNDCPYIRELYKGCQFFTESWAYGMNTTKKSCELIILPPSSLSYLSN